ncbi:MAG: antirestriction protein ArdA [Halanaerobiales bacterium]|nr:antirestriction protein ArdA [Halanaerobiales bacterium]
MAMAMTEVMNVYVANLAKYNEGIYKAEWVSLPTLEKDLNEQMEQILGNDEEYIILDYESELDLDIDEFSNP